MISSLLYQEQKAWSIEGAPSVHRLRNLALRKLPAGIVERSIDHRK